MSSGAEGQRDLPSLGGDMEVMFISSRCLPLSILVTWSHTLTRDVGKDSLWLGVPKPSENSYYKMRNRWNWGHINIQNRTWVTQSKSQRFDSQHFQSFNMVGCQPRTTPAWCVRDRKREHPWKQIKVQISLTWLGSWGILECSQSYQRDQTPVACTITWSAFLSHSSKPFYLLPGINFNITYLYWNPYFWDNTV